MTELGQFLKEKREEFGWDLEEVQTRTKIQKRYLQAIEEGHYGDLPGAFYARAFIKSYSEVLGLEPEEVFEQFESDLPKPKQEAVELPSRAEQAKSTRSKEREKKNSILPAVLVGFFLIALVAGVWYVFVMPSAGDDVEDDNDNVGDMDIIGTEEPDDEDGADEDGEEAPATDDPEGTEEDEDENNEEESDEETDNTLTFEETNDNNESIFTVTGGTTLTIDLEFSEDGESYIEFRDERYGDPIEAGGVLSSDETFEFDDQDELTINVGNIFGVTIFVNGEELEYPVDTHHHFITIQQEG